MTQHKSIARPRGRWCTRSRGFYRMTFKEYTMSFPKYPLTYIKSSYVGVMRQAMKAERKLEDRVLISMMELGYNARVKSYLVRQGKIKSFKQFQNLEKRKKNNGLSYFSKKLDKRSPNRYSPRE